MRKELIKELINSELILNKAADLALGLQKNVNQLNKKHDGELRTSLVTEADVKVQELILKELIKTKLKRCKLFAEEKSPSVNKFNPKGKYILAIDPIDGTERYLNQEKFFSLIISLHNQNSFCYTYIRYPAFKLSIRIKEKKIIYKGSVPNLKINQTYPKTIMVVRGEPKKETGRLFSKYSKLGYRFIERGDLINKSGTTTILLAFHKKINGYYCSNPNAYDGLLELHFAQASGYKVYQGTRGKINLKKTFDDSGIPRHRGYFLAIIK